MACRFLAAGRHPDPDPLAAFRRRFLAEWADRLVQGRERAQEMTRFTRGTLSLDGTKGHANASRQRALSQGHLATLETPLKAEGQEVRALAEQADRADVPDGVSVPDESQRRAARLTALAPAKAKSEARAQERVEREPADSEATRARREAKAKESGQKPPGKPPPPAASGVQAAEPINLPEDASRLRPGAGGGVEPASTAQAAVASGRRWVGVPAGTQAPNDPEPRVPRLAPRAALPEAWGEVDQRRADPGVCRARQGAAGEAAGLEPLSAVAREEPHAGWRACVPEPAPLPEGASAVHRLAPRLKTSRGRAAYARRKQTVEPVFGSIKSVRGFRPFLRRGVVTGSGDWRLVCLAWKLKRLACLRRQT